MKQLVLVLLAAAMTSAFAAFTPAAHTGAAGAAPASGASQLLPFATIDKGYFSSWPLGTASFAVQNETDWAKTWELHAPGTNPPAIDFNKFEVYCSFLGQLSSGGFDTEITAVKTAQACTIVQVQTVAPGPFCNVIMIMTSPYHMVVAPRHGALPVRMIENLTIIKCK